jgi:hypothetical protein
VLAEVSEKGFGSAIAKRRGKKLRSFKIRRNAGPRGYSKSCNRLARIDRL